MFSKVTKNLYKKINKTRSFSTIFAKNKKSILISSTLFGIGFATFAFQAANTKKPSSPLSKSEFKEFELSHRAKITHDTDLFRFKIPEYTSLQMPIASCIVAQGNVEGEEKPVTRPYTPTSTNEDKGFFELVVKEYPNGKLSKYIHNLKPGQKLSVKGPFPKIEYKANMKKEIGMIAGGTGITPMFQVIQEVLKNPNDETRITLLFGNKSEDDVILKTELDRFAINHPNFNVVYVIDKATDEKNWEGEVGYINSDLVKKYLPKPSSDSLILVCGPPPMVKAIAGSKTKDYKQGPLDGLLKDLGFDETNVYKF